VVLFHAGVPGLRGGFVGVDIFYVISGFVITGLLLRRGEGRRKVSLVDFYGRRARRILPMATLVILATVAASYLWLGRFVGASVAADGRVASVFLANVQAMHVGTDYFHAGGPVSPLLNYWSLSVEEQFYLAFPLLVVLVLSLGRRGGEIHRMVVATSAIVAGSFLLCVLQTSGSPVVAFFSPLTRAWELGIGALCVLLTQWASRWRSSTSVVLGWLGLSAIVWSAIAYSAATPFPGVAALVPVVGAGLVLLAGSTKLKAGPESLLGARPMQWGGNVSYSLYLWHFPVLIIAAEAATSSLSGLTRAGLVLLAVALAEGSRRLVEDPIRHARRLGASWRASLLVGAVLVAASVGITSILIATTGAPAASPRAHRPQAVATSLAGVEARVAAGTRTSEVPAGVVPPLGPATESLAGPKVPQGCVVEEAGVTSVDPCIFGNRASATTVLLLGDSTSAMWSSAFIHLAEQRQLRLVLLAKTGCAPWLNRDLIFGGGANPYCDRWHRFEVAEAARLKPDAIVVTGFVGEPASTADVPGGVRGLLVALKRVTPNVTVLSNLPAVPKGSADPATCVLVHPKDVRPCAIDYRAFAESYGWFRASLEGGAKATGAEFVDLDPLFCTSTTCPMVVSRHLVWRDLFHANVAYVTWVSTALGELLDRASWLSDPRA
jgi:peptidoglycan/LPS O-acetylase OafA/YrhL